MGQNIYLYSRDTKGKIRIMEIRVNPVIIQDPQGGVETSIIQRVDISKTTGLLDGKHTAQPTVTIYKGKAGRTITQQVELQVNSLISKQMDKGYKLLSDLTIENVDPFDYNTIDDILPTVKTHINGHLKLMLAKDPKPGNQFFDIYAAPTPRINKAWLVSRKLDGVRASVRMDKHGNFEAMSRSGKSLNVAFTNIFKDINLLRLFQTIGEDKMLDGELYIHGKPLQEITGVVALKDYDPLRHDELMFWIFDFADHTTTAVERDNRLKKFVIQDPSNSRIFMNKQSMVTDYLGAKNLHDTFIGQGFEGAILRDPESLYGYGTRDDRMIKLKEFQDDEFQIVGYKLGLRGAEDMCFECVTKDGKKFEAKPLGDKQAKLGYVADFDNINGKLLTVKFFNYTKDGIPNLPSGVAVRDYE